MQRNINFWNEWNARNMTRLITHDEKVCSDQQKNVFWKNVRQEFYKWKTMKTRINEKKNTEFF